ncbi:MetS family NSS transporter small subunit [Propionigenium maris]|nr:MetS family NSS transporter small subunit [Propionigenium maris]
MSTDAVITALISMSILWGGFAFCLRIAIKTDK